MSEEIEENFDAEFELADGTCVKVQRMTNRDVRIIRGDHSVTLPKASGQLTLEVLGLLNLESEEKK